MFADCFPGSIRFTDLDGVVERHGKFALLEWKSLEAPRKLPQGQHTMFKRLASQDWYVIVVWGDTKTKVIKGYAEYWDGRKGRFVSANKYEAKTRLRKWAQWVEGGNAEKPWQPFPHELAYTLDGESDNPF